MPVIGSARKFHKKFKFLVEIDGFVSAKFQKCSALEVEIAKVEYKEGGAEYPTKDPGMSSFSDVTLERGATDDEDIYNWLKEVIDAPANSGLVDPEFRRNADIVQLDRDGSELRRWTLHRAWPSKFVGGEWDNDADENTMESVTLTFDFFEKSN